MTEHHDAVNSPAHKVDGVKASGRFVLLPADGSVPDVRELPALRVEFNVSYPNGDEYAEQLPGWLARLIPQVERALTKELTARFPTYRRGDDE